PLPLPPRPTPFPYTTLFRSVTADQISRRLADLYSASGGLIRQSLARTRARLAHWAGPTHTWWKVGGVLAAFALLFGLFGRLPYRDRKSTRLNSSHLGISYAV